MADKQTVTVYDGEIRLGGDLMNVIPRTGMTDQEIRVLRAIHGDDGVVNLKESDVIEIDPQEHLYELAVKYSASLNPAYGVKLVERVFGVQLTGFARWNEARKERAEQEQRERLEASQRAIAEQNRIREVVEARTRAEMQARSAGLQPA